MARHIVLTSDGMKFETDVEPVEQGSFLVVTWNGQQHRVPMMKLRDWITLSDAPAAAVVVGDAPAEPELSVLAEPGPATVAGTAPGPSVGAVGPGAPRVGQPRGSERPLPNGHPALGGGQQMVEVEGQLVPVADGGLSPGETEVLG